MSERYGIGTVEVRRGRTTEWGIAQTMTPDDARQVAYALGLNDAAAKELLAAADEADALNETGW